MWDSKPRVLKDILTVDCPLTDLLWNTDSHFLQGIVTRGQDCSRSNSTIINKQYSKALNWRSFLTGESHNLLTKKNLRKTLSPTNFCRLNYDVRPPAWKWWCPPPCNPDPFVPYNPGTWKLGLLFWRNPYFKSNYRGPDRITGVQIGFVRPAPALFHHTTLNIYVNFL